jgi:hypothetical protein
MDSPEASGRIAVCSSFPSSWGELAGYTGASHRAWAERHGYDYHADCSERTWPAHSPDWGAVAIGRLPIRGFIKLDLMLHYLDAELCGNVYDWVVWLDSDLIITNPEIPLARWTDDVAPYAREPNGTTSGADLIMPYDFNGNNATVIIARNTDAAYNYVWSSNDAGRTMFLKHDWAEMEALLRFREAPPYDGIVHAVSAKELCALHPGAYEPLPKRRTAAYEWETGDFAVHLAALSLERRIELAQHYSGITMADK